MLQFSSSVPAQSRQLAGRSIKTSLAPRLRQQIPRLFSTSRPRNAIKTKLTEILGIRVPVVMAAMQWVGVPSLAAAVSRAGGLGNITALSQPNADALRTAIHELRSGANGNPFCVNITTLPTITPPDYLGYAKAAVEEGVKIFELAGTISIAMPLIKYFKEQGCTVIYKGYNVEDSKIAEDLGADLITIDSFECVGLSSSDDIGGIVLHALAAKKLKVPFIASGGIANGSQLAAALALGASGVNMGTRIMCTKESSIHENIKKTMVDSNETDSIQILATLGNRMRVYKNKVSVETVEIENRPGGCQFSDVRHLVAGARGRQVYENGDPDYGIWAAGMSLGLVDDVPSCEDLLRKLEADAEGVLAGLSKLQAPSIPHQSSQSTETIFAVQWREYKAGEERRGVEQHFLSWY